MKTTWKLCAMTIGAAFLLAIAGSAHSAFAQSPKQGSGQVHLREDVAPIFKEHCVTLSPIRVHRADVADDL